MEEGGPEATEDERTSENLDTETEKMDVDPQGTSTLKEDEEKTGR